MRVYLKFFGENFLEMLEEYMPIHEESDLIIEQVLTPDIQREIANIMQEVSGEYTNKLAGELATTLSSRLAQLFQNVTWGITSDMETGKMTVTIHLGEWRVV